MADRTAADVQAITDMIASLAGDYEKAVRFSTYLGEFQQLATQLNGDALAVEWYLTETPAGEAAAWANLGYTPQGAKPLIDSGITPAMADDADSAGGSVLERIALLADAGIDTTGIDLTALD